MAYIETSPQGWGATVDYDQWTDRKFIKDRIFVHYNGPAVSNYTDGVTREMAYLRAVERYHIANRGWRGIAYGWAVGASGRVYRLRGWNRYGAHRGDYDMDGILENDEGIPILFILGEGQAPTPAQLASFVELVTDLNLDNRSDHDLEILGHKDVQATACPGPILYELVETGFPTTPLTGTAVISQPRASQKQGEVWATVNAKRKGSPYTDSQVKEIVAQYWKVGVEYGVDPALAIAQSAKETGYWSYGGDVKADQWNFAGIGATGGVPGITFSSIEAGVRAHVLRMRMYAKYDPAHYDITVLVRPLPTSYWGKCPTIEKFNGVWAVPGTGYGQSVVNDYLAPLVKTVIEIEIPLTLEQRVARLERFHQL